MQFCCFLDFVVFLSCTGAVPAQETSCNDNCAYLPASDSVSAPVPLCYALRICGHRMTNPICGKPTAPPVCTT